MRASTLHRVPGVLPLGIPAHHLDVLPHASLPAVVQATAGVLTGSLSLLVSLPTTVVAFLRYSRDQAFGGLGRNARSIATMAVGSVAGSVAGGLLLGTVSEAVLVPLAVVLLLASAVEVRRRP